MYVNLMKYVQGIWLVCIQKITLMCYIQSQVKKLLKEKWGDSHVVSEKNLAHIADVVWVCIHLVVKKHENEIKIKTDIMLAC